MSIPILIFVIVVLIALSAFFSSSEMVFSSANRMRLENESEKGSASAKLALNIVDRFENALSAILVGNNLVNIATSSIGSVIAVTLWGEGWTWVMTVILTIAVIIFGETIPKIVAKKNANSFVLLLCYPVRFLTILLKPVTVVVVSLVDLIMLVLPKPRHRRTEDEIQREFQSMIETAEDENVLDEDQSELLQAALEFDDTSIWEIMTARVDIMAIDQADDWDDILAAAEKSTCSRMPVYEDSLDHIVGILYLNQFYCQLTAAGQLNLSSILEKPVYLYKTTKLPAAIRILREANQRMGIVVDEYGGTMGLVTIEDIMEQLVGEIWDENDPVGADEIIEHALGVYELDGDMQLSDFVELVGWREDDLDDIESVTVGGLTTELYGGFPKEGDIITIKNAEIKVLDMDRLRVGRVLVTLLPELPSDSHTEE